MCDGSEKCGCSISLSTVIDDGSTRRAIVDKVKIDKNKFLNGDLKEITIFAYMVNPKDFNERLNKIGLKITNIEQDAEFLSALSKKGMDKEGVMKDVNGNKIYFNYVDLLKSIKLDKKVIDKTKFNFV